MTKQEHITEATRLASVAGKPQTRNEMVTYIRVNGFTKAARRFGVAYVRSLTQPVPASDTAEED